MDPIDHPVSRYAIDVVEGRIVAGQLVRLACARHLRDLETGRDRGLWFDTQAASMVTRFGRMLTHTAGPMAGKPLELQPWQKFRIGSVFGWKRDDGLRRFRSTYHQVGKKNGKTTETALPLIWSQTFDGEERPLALCAATNSKQASILFNDVQAVIRKSPVLAQLMDAYRYEIRTKQTGGVITTVSRDSDSMDGLNPSFLARDELHRWTDVELSTTLVESMIARSQPIDWAITTAGHDIGSICGTVRTYAESVLKGDVTDDKFFAYVAEPPKDADPLDPVAWQMGNPNLGVSKPVDEMRARAEKAQVIAADMPNFRRFHLNLWTEGAGTWISRDVWDANGQADRFDERMLYGRKAWVGLDLSETTDTTAIVIAVPKDGLIYLIAYSFIPAGAKGFIARAMAEKREYVGWRQDGWLEVHEGGTIDEAALVRRLIWVRDTFDVQELAYDRWGMKYMVRDLIAHRLPVVEHGQGTASMSAPMKRFEGCVANGRIRHNGNPMLAWQVGNVQRDMDPAGNIKPNKKKSRLRIDAAVAAIMAVGRAEAGASKKKSVRDVEVV